MNAWVHRRWRGRDSDAGSVSVELAILAPLVGLLLLCVVVVGRTQNSRADVEGAARSAARDLSIARDPEAAIGRVRSTASAMVDAGSPGCRDFELLADIGAEAVTVTVSCTADLQEAALLPVPGHVTLTGSATEPIDRYREGG